MKFSDATSEGYKVFDSIPDKWLKFMVRPHLGEIILGRLGHFTMISYVGDLVSATHPIWLVGFL
jgi:hypothetical protein